ncbi:hypothetical protein M0R45_003428 [Rubus argutus]|uniref:Uncharacterized protein n=1 Tax=Rubus argutus TaxID=59490 RepID=A0AAW1YF35_RUBAR
MNTPSNGRSQRPKGFKVKLAFQIVSLLAVCFWLLYQAKQSHGKDYRESVQNKASKELGSGILGRKANLGGSNIAGESVNDGDRSGGVDVLDGNVEEKKKDSSLNKINDDTHGDDVIHEGRESEKEMELKHKGLNVTDDNSDIELKADNEAVGLDEISLQDGDSQVGHEDKQPTMSDQDGEKYVKNISHDEVGEDEEQNPHVNHGEQGHQRDIQKDSETNDFNHGEQGHERDIQKDSETNDFSANNEALVQPTERKNDSLQDSANNEALVQPTERKNDSLQDPNSMVGGVHGFDDENGVPVDSNDIIESGVTGSIGDGEINIHEEMYSRSNSQSETNESMESEKVVSRGNGADFEAGSKISVEESKLKAETSSETSVLIDTPRTNSVIGTTKGGSSVSDS